MSSYKTIQAIKETDGPDLKVDEYSISEDGTVRMLVKNVGGMDAQLDDVETNYYEFKLSNNPLIKAGETKEVFGKIDGNMDKGEPNFRLVYRSTELGCLSCKEFGISAEQTCTNDDECITGLCCAGKCREPSKGFCDDTDRDGIPDTWVKTG